MTARRPPFALVVAALIAAGALWSFGGLEPHDESWFVQVTDRVGGGESLYRDVFYGAMPLAVYVVLPFVWLFGAQVLWVKALVVACFAGCLLLLVSIGRRIEATNVELAAAGAALLVWAPPQRSTLYQPLATLLLLACLAAALAWLDSRSARTLALAGALAGLAFATKQNVGAFAAAALLMAILGTGRSARVRAVAIAAAAFAGTVAVTLVPVLATGGLRELWDYGFANRGSYADSANVSYLDGIDTQLDAIRESSHTLADRASAVVHGYELAAFALVPLVLLALAVAWIRARGLPRARMTVVGAFTLAAAAAIFPRADMAHVLWVFPLFVVAGLCACKALVPERRLRTAAVVLLVVLAPVLLARAFGQVAQLADGSKRFSDLPHARGVLIEPAEETEIADAAAALEREERPVFLATTEAGILYLASGIENATPFDYPLVTAFGRDGEEGLAEDVERGRFATVCVDFGEERALVPTRLAGAIERSLTRAEDLGVCRVYRRAPR
jgi:Glycosyltransferase family 87